MSPRVKVIVPCYGYGELLEGCVRSILSQEGVRVEVLIIDDCSPDQTMAVGQRLAQSDDRVEYRRHTENLGLIPTANEGLEWAGDGDYVLLLSADDLLVPGAFERATSIMESDPNVGLVYGHAQRFGPDDPPTRYGTRWRGTTRWSGRDWIELRCRAGHNCISSPEAVVRTSVQMQAGAYDERCPHSSDLNMWLRLATISDIAFVKGAAQALYRIHPESMLRSAMNSESGTMIDLHERSRAFELALADKGPEVAARLALVRRTLARQALWQASRAYDRGEVEGPGAPPVGELISFALETCPETRRLREWRGLRLRQRIGAGRSGWFLPFLVTGAAHRLLGHMKLWRWRLHGV